jgi:hypothetical protein
MDPTYVDVSKGSPMRRVPSGVRDATLREALNNIRSKQDHFQQEGLRKTNFTIGVITTVVTAYVLGGHPEWYWVFYCAKVSVFAWPTLHLLSKRVGRGCTSTENVSILIVVAHIIVP